MIMVTKDKQFWCEQIACTKKGWIRIDQNDNYYNAGKCMHWGYEIAPTQLMDWNNDTL